MIGTAYWYMHTDQWRYDGYRADALASPLAKGHFAGMHTADTIAQSARLGWMPFYPQFDRNPLDLADEAAAATGDVADAHVADAAAGRQPALRRSRTSTPRRTGRARLTLWRANLLGSSAKGNEYFLQHLLGTHYNVHGASRPRPTAGRATSPGATTSPRGQARPAAVGRLPDDRRPRCCPTSCCPRPPGTRSTTSPPPTCTRSCTPSPPRSTRRGRPRPTSTPSTPSPAQLLRAGPDPPRRAPGPGRRAAAARHPRRDRAARRPWCATGAQASARPSPGRTMPSLVVVERDYTGRSPTSWPRSGRWPTGWASRSRTSPTGSTQEVAHLARRRTG